MVSSRRSGYVLLLSVLITGVVAAVVVSSLLLLGTASNRASFSVQQSSQSLSFMQACADDALFQIAATAGSYAGNETLTFPEGTCSILPIHFSINEGVPSNGPRFICIESSTAGVLRRLEIVVQEIQPRIIVQSWQEVGTFTICQ